MNREQTLAALVEPRRAGAADRGRRPGEFPQGVAADPGRGPRPTPGRSTCTCGRSSCPSCASTDRCVSCHVGMAPASRAYGQPRRSRRTSPWSTIRPSSAARSATADRAERPTRPTPTATCHFWPEPMIPAEFAYAGCGSCHTHLRVPNQAQLQRGLSLGRALRLPGLPSHRRPRRHVAARRRGRHGRPGPVARRRGRLRPRLVRTASAAVTQAARTGPGRAPSDRSTQPDREAIAEFLASRVGAPELVEAKALFHSLGCRGCHKVGGVGGDDGPDLTLVGDRDPGRLDFTHVPGEPTLANWLAEHFRDPARSRARLADAGAWA